MPLLSLLPPQNPHHSLSSNSNNSTIGSVYKSKQKLITQPQKTPLSSRLLTRFLLSSSTPSLKGCRQGRIPARRGAVVQIFQEASPSVVIATKGGENNKKQLPLAATTAVSPVIEEEDEELRDAKVEGSGSGFVWDKARHIVTNYHVIAKLATDQSGLQRCKMWMETLFLGKES